MQGHSVKRGEEYRWQKLVRIIIAPMSLVGARRAPKEWGSVGWFAIQATRGTVSISDQRSYRGRLDYTYMIDLEGARALSMTQKMGAVA